MRDWILTALLFVFGILAILDARKRDIQRNARALQEAEHLLKLIEERDKYFKETVLLKCELLRRDIQDRLTPAPRPGND